jgi:dihydroxy-acid dehydratase
MRSDNVKEEVKRAPHRSLFKAMGVTDEQLKRPIVGIACISNEIIPGHYHTEQLVKAVRDGILMAGGLPISFSTIGVCDGIAMNHRGMKFSLPSRELIADSIEVMAEAHAFDALVLIPNCDKSIPGMIMGAARIKIPFLVLTGGPMLPGKFKGAKVDLGSVFEGVASYHRGDISQADLMQLENNACPGFGCCSGMYTANSMGCVCEALGLSVPYAATALSTSGERMRLAKETGIRVVRMTEQNIVMNDIIRPESFDNAITVDVALGCSTNSLLHIPAIANAFGYHIDFDLFNRISDRTPQLGSFRPGGTFYVEDLHQVGGVPAVIHELMKKELICEEMTNGLGTRWKEAAAECALLNYDMVKSIKEPYNSLGGLVVLKGNLAPEGAVIKRSAVDKSMYLFKGKARVFEGEEDAYSALINGQISKGSVVVIRNEGPKGGPGMREMLAPTQALVASGLDKDVYLVTDGRFSGASSGPAIGYVAPEAAEGGMIGLVKDGDEIIIDLEQKELKLQITDDEINRRIANRINVVSEEKSEFLLRYKRNVTSASSGAIFKK